MFRLAAYHVATEPPAPTAQLAGLDGQAELTLAYAFGPHRNPLGGLLPGGRRGVFLPACRNLRESAGQQRTPSSSPG